MRRALGAGLVVLLILASGCAHWTVKRIVADKNYPNQDAAKEAINDAPTGLRFYAPEPYVWILPGANGGCTATDVYLPNFSKAYVLKAGGLGSTSMKPALTNGWNLTTLEATANTQTAEVLNAVGSIIGSLAKFAPAADVAKGAGAPPQVFGPGLYHLVSDENTGLITNLVPVFRVTGPDGNPAPCPPPKKE